MIDEQKVLYKIKPNKFFAKEQATSSWTKAKELLKETTAKTRKHIAILTVFYNGDFKGLFPVTDVTAIEKPRLEVWTDYEKMIKRAIDLKASAQARNDDIAVYFIDKKLAKISGDFRATYRWKARNGDILSSVVYVPEDKVKELKKQVA